MFCLFVIQRAIFASYHAARADYEATSYRVYFRTVDVDTWISRCRKPCFFEEECFHVCRARCGAIIEALLWGNSVAVGTDIDTG